MDEFKSNLIKETTETSEFQPIKENVIPLENQPIAESQTTGEYQTAPQAPNHTINREKKQNALSVLSGGLVTAIATVVVGMTGMLNVAMTADFENVTYQDSAIVYQVAVENMTEEESLYAYLYEGTKLIEKIDLVDDDGDGMIDGSIAVDSSYVQGKLDQGASKVEYRLDLKGVVGLNVERSFDSYVVRIESVTSAFESVEGHCNCGVDGYYYFTMNFSDDVGIFSDFSACIQDKAGNVSYCNFTDNLHEEQRISVTSLQGSACTLIISYNVQGEDTPRTVEQEITL